ncbi:cupin domain-containing protein [Amycolatopsis sp. H20-H5]|uniref:cupin domain-containing protein n=1 Tax=Amycolatopsis sp. H20-H5 TaxID=3046309 RepID=UPI002DB820EE|nr:cupin domain-containing protein [Amycolatopsis sp. H20-H5]MEC3980522.1 cupin domain-containing protein [Amycolatopsis sp. H20-H5]
MRVAQKTGSHRVQRVWEGVTIRAVHGELVTLAVAELEPNVVVPEHQHVNEQIGLVLSGSATFTAGGERVELTAGGTYRLPANVPHEVEAGPGGAVFVESFSPIREDWKALPEEATPRLRWPAE